MRIIRPNNVYIDTEISLKSEFANDSQDAVILLGPGLLEQNHELADFRQTDKTKVIVYNQAQLGNSNVKSILNFKYFSFISMADEVWDYDEHNINILKLIRPDIKLHVLKPCEELNAGIMEKDIDVLFYGLMNKRRQDIIDTLTQNGLNVFVANGIWGDKLNSYIARSKILLNVHYYPITALQEQARMIRWVSTPGVHIVSERSRTNYLNITEVSYDELVATCMHIIKQCQ